MDIITKFDRIEDILGSSDGRYFGNGYTQVKYFQKVKHITFEGIESVFEINYPKSWSTKKNIESIKPHFSSLDSIVLAVKLVSDFLREELVKEGGFDLLAFGRPLLINENWFDEITEEA